MSLHRSLLTATLATLCWSGTASALDSYDGEGDDSADDISWDELECDEESGAYTGAIVTGDGEASSAAALASSFETCSPGCQAGCEVLTPLEWASTWDESFSHWFDYVLVVDQQVVAAMVGRDWASVEGEEQAVAFDDLYVFSAPFACMAYRSDGELVQALSLEFAEQQEGDVSVVLEKVEILEAELSIWEGGTQYHPDGPADAVVALGFIIAGYGDVGLARATSE
jgi:hypothetical protein